MEFLQRAVWPDNSCPEAVIVLCRTGLENLSNLRPRELLSLRQLAVIICPPSFCVRFPE